MITVDELMLEFHWEDEEMPTVTRKYDGAIALIKGAGAFVEDNPVTSLVISEMVGIMMENRGGGTDFADIRMFPLSIQALINSLRYGDHDGEED